MAKKRRLSPNSKEWWTKARRTAHSKIMLEWLSWQDFDVSERGWTEEVRKKHSAIIKGVWKKRSKAERERIRDKQKLWHLEVKFANLNGRKPSYKWVLELRRFRALVG